VVPDELKGRNIVTPLEIIKVVSSEFDVSIAKLQSKSRVRNIVLARHLCMYLMASETGLSYSKIITYFNQKDHTAVIHARRNINNLIFTDDQLLMPRYRQVMEKLF
jgi:chromosomal replication initiator protein